MKILVTGGAGFIGSHICDLLVQNNHTVVCFDNFSTGRMRNLSNCELRENFYLHPRDILDFPSVVQVFQDFQPQIVLHLAAQSAISTAENSPIEDLNNNAVGTLNIIRAAKANGCKKIVCASTSAVYKETNKRLNEGSILCPATNYGVSKLASEFYLRGLFNDVTILRLANIYGPRQTPLGENQVIARMIRHFKYGDDFQIFGDGKQKRDYMYVKDVAVAFLKAMYGRPGIYNVATDVSMSVNEIASIIERLYDVEGYKWIHREEPDPRQIVQMSNNLMKKTYKMHKLTPIAKGIAETVAWWEALDG